MFRRATRTAGAFDNRLKGPAQITERPPFDTSRAKDASHLLRHALPLVIADVVLTSKPNKQKLGVSWILGLTAIIENPPNGVASPRPESNPSLNARLSARLGARLSLSRGQSEWGCPTSSLRSRSGRRTGPFGSHWKVPPGPNAWPSCSATTGGRGDAARGIGKQRVVEVALGFGRLVASFWSGRFGHAHIPS